MRMASLIARKRDGGVLSDAELEAIVARVVSGSLPEAQLGAWLMACQWRGLNADETAALTRAMLDSGARLSWDGGPVVDKHSTGGVGDAMSLALAPALIACGAQVPMLAGRGLAHTGGTIDKLESIPGFDSQPSLARLRELRSFIAAQSPEIAPADRVLYALRDVTATVPCVGLITASILSKKAAEGLDALVLDVKCGRAAFMRELDQARTLARSMVETGQRLGIDTAAQITRMDHPIGRFVGNAIEVRAMLEVLEGGGDPDARELVVLQGGLLLEMVGRGDAASIEAVLDDGRARTAWSSLIEAQGGDPDAELPAARRRTTLTGPAGIVQDLDALSLGEVACSLGAGRDRPGEAIDPAVGLELHVGVGDPVPEEGWITVHHQDELARTTVELLQGALRVGDDPVTPANRLLELVR